VNHRVACSTYGYSFLSLEGALERIADNGFQTVDINGTRPHLLPADYPDPGLRELKAKIDDLGLRVSAISPFDGHPFWHFTAANPRHRAATIAHVKSCIDVAAALGASVVQATTGTPVAQDVTFDVAWGWARDGLHECAEHGRTKEVGVALESEENNVVRSSSDVRRMLDDVDHSHLKGLLEIGHAALMATDDPVRAVETLSTDLIYVHAHDNHGTDDDHNAPGDGIVDWAPIFRALERVGYRGDFALELLVANPDGAAVQGAEFLSRFLNGGARSRLS
jgi:sugar phosphate isomerase/epimerase